MTKRRLVTISYTGLDAGGGVPKFNRDLHKAFSQERECVHYCWADSGVEDHWHLNRIMEPDKAMYLNRYLTRMGAISHDDVIVADGFWADGLQQFPYAISHSHGIWGHITWEDTQRAGGCALDNPALHHAQVSFRYRWTHARKRLSAVSAFIAENMEAMWGFKVDRVIDNGVDVTEFKPSTRDSGLNDLLIVHGVNDRGNVNKGWDHIELIKKSLAGVHVLSLDEAQQLLNSRHEQPWTKAETLAQADLVVHPSGYEGNSMFVAETLACGVPIVGYDVGFLYSVRGRDKDIGRIMDRNWRSPEMTLENVQEVLDDPAEASLQGMRARDLAVDMLSIDQFRRNWKEYIYDVEDGYYGA